MSFWDDKQEGDFEALDKGTYMAKLVEADLNVDFKNKSGVKYPLLKLRWKVSEKDPNFANRLLFQDIRFMDSMGWKVNKELTRLDCKPDVADDADWQTVAECAAGLIFKKVDLVSHQLEVDTRAYQGKVYNEVGLAGNDEDEGDAFLDTDDEIPY